MCVWTGRPSAIGTDVDTGLVGVLEVAHLEVELAMIRDVLRARGATQWRLAGVMMIACQVVGPPSCTRSRSAVDQRADLRAALVVHPGRTGRLGQDGRVQADLLEGRRTVVVVREGQAEAAVHTGHVDQRVHQDALDVVRAPQYSP